jgi:serine/threonine protein kinase
MTETPTSRPSPDDKARIEAVVAECIEALERGEADPATRLCAGDGELLTRVQRRLAHLAARGLIPDSETLPARIGPYRVLKELGSGGMGHVYLADQLEPVRRQVALKVIKLGMDTREVVARFQAERQALALMNHPNIAQVFDAGITAEGRPYFVMEYVPGRALTSFCDERQLGTEARVRLMATICRAVQHAHDRGFIHRDLKPSNILVSEHKPTGAPESGRDSAFVPKVIDFGVAKATAAAADSAMTQAASLRTRADQVLGTPEYMSPEQMSSGGLDVDTRSDVYSLGVTLYELLCGELPFDSRRLRSVGRTELERILRDELPTQPSKRLSAVRGDVVVARGTERGTLQRIVAGELDWITLKALGKQREQRYASALALAEDLERWLRHEPVLAAPPGRTYRLRKFVRRHRVWVGAAAAVLLALIAGLVVSLRANVVANEALARESAALADMRAYFALARDAVGNVAEIAAHQLGDVPQAEPVRERMLADALRFNESLRAREPRDPALRLARLAAIEQVGTLQLQLGRPSEAAATLAQCVAEAETLHAQQPSAEAMLRAVTAGEELAKAESALERWPAARDALRAALATLERARSFPGVSANAANGLEATLLARLAMALDDDTPAALATFDRAFAAFDRAADDKPAAVLRRVQAMMRHGEALTRANRLDDAATVLADAAQRAQAVRDGASTRTRAAAADALVARSVVLRRLDRLDEARTTRHAAREQFERLASEHQARAAYAASVAAAWYFVAQLDEQQADLPAAMTAATTAAQQYEALATRFPQQWRYGMDCARALLLVADVQMQTAQKQGGDREEAAATLARAQAIVDPLYERHGDDGFEIVQTFASVHTTIALLHTMRQQYADALREHTAIRDAIAARGAQYGGDPNLHYLLALAGNNRFQALYLMRRPGEALEAALAGREHLERGLALDARHHGLRELLPTLLGRIAAAQHATGDADAAVATLLALGERAEWGRDANEYGALLLANRLDSLEDHPEREAWLQRVAPLLRSALQTRGSVDAARQRPAQQTGFSSFGSRLRDFDLRVALASVCGMLEQRDEQARWLAEAGELDATLPGLSADRVRNLFAQRAECALARGDVAATEAAVDGLLHRVGERGGVNYMLAVLLTRAFALAPPDGKERLATKAIACLRRSIDNGEVPRAAAGHESFAPLRGRPDHAELCEK